jgi:hypothetical protein
MNGAKSYVIRALLGAALLSTGLVRPAAAVLPTPVPSPTPSYALTADRAKVTSVGVVPAAGEQGDAILKLTGSFVFDGALDLASSSVTIRALLDEIGGAGELLKGLGGSDALPAVLFRKSGNDSSVTYTSAGSARPSFRLALHRKPGGLYTANLRVNRATVSSDPTLCTGSPESTVLDTVLVIDDGHNPPATVAGSLAWVCVLDQDKLRLSASSDQPQPGLNQPPDASVRTNLLTRTTGQPSLVLLDGSNSRDADGTIVSYTFQVALHPSGQVVFGPLTGANPAITTTLPPGDYTVSLVVIDNLGAASQPDTRTVSIK